MKEQLEAIKAQAIAELEAASSAAELEQLRVNYLGKKSPLTAALKNMGSLTPEERPVVGQLANAIKAEIAEALDAAKAKIGQLELAKKLEKRWR